MTRARTPGSFCTSTESVCVSLGSWRSSRKYADAGWFIVVPSSLSSRHRPFGDRRVCSNPAAEQIEIDIATGEHETDALPLQLVFLLKRRGARGGPRAFGEIVRAGPVGSDRGCVLIVRLLHDVRRTLANDGESIRMRDAGSHAVGQRVAGLGGHDCASGKRQ